MASNQQYHEVIEVSVVEDTYAMGEPAADPISIGVGN